MTNVDIVVNVRMVDFHQTKANEMVCENEDGSYTVLINSRMDYETQLQAYYHALSHIRNHDFEKSDVQEIESEAHRNDIDF